MVTISELARTTGFSGPHNHRFADTSSSSVITIDESSSTQNNINTSIDCYVSGVYIGRKGDSIEVRQRYTVFVSYSRSTQKLAMQQVRNKIMADFEMNFPNFNVRDVFIPENAFVVPLGDEGMTEPAQFYYGSELFKMMSRRDVGRFKVDTEKRIYGSRVDHVMRKYGLKR